MRTRDVFGYHLLATVFEKHKETTATNRRLNMLSVRFPEYKKLFSKARIIVKK